MIRGQLTVNFLLIVAAFVVARKKKQHNYKGVSYVSRLRYSTDCDSIIIIAAFIRPIAGHRQALRIIKPWVVVPSRALANWQQIY